MSFAAPLALSLFALAAPVVVLYILKVKRRRVTVPYLRLWESLVVETRARSLFKRLKRLLSLLLQLLILSALVLSVAEPALELSSVKKESIVLLLDASASMKAEEDEDRTRFDELLERAREIVEGRSYEDEMMVAVVSDRVDVLAPFNRNTLRLRGALEHATVTNRSLDADGALAFARQVTAGRDEPVILFLSDGAGGRVVSAIADDETARLVPIGTASENVGIVRFSSRKNSSLGTDFVLAVVRNFGEEDTECRLELSLDGATQKVLTRTIPAGEAITENFQLALPRGGTLLLEVDTDDCLDLDDRAWAVVRPGRLRRVLVVARTLDEAIPFQIAFQSMGEVIDPESFAVTAAEYPNLSDDERRADITLCVGALPADLSGAGNLILLDTPLPDFLPAKIAGEDPAPSVWDWDREHVLNRYLNYRDVVFPPAKTLAIEAGTTLVETYEGPIIGAFEAPGRMTVYVGFDMTAKLFPFRLAFPMLVRNAIAWFEVEEDLVLEASYPPGATIRPLRRVPDGAMDVTFFRDGEMVQRKLTADAGRFTFDETGEPGAYLFRFAGANHATSVNLFDANESDVTPDTGEEDGEGALYAEEGRHFLNRDLWAILAMIGLVLWTLEWAFFHRRVTE